MEQGTIGYHANSNGGLIVKGYNFSQCLEIQGIESFVIIQSLTTVDPDLNILQWADNSRSWNLRYTYRRETSDKSEEKKMKLTTTLCP